MTAKTIPHPLKHAWKRKDAGLRYYFCFDTDCDVVYFRDDDSGITKHNYAPRMA